MTATMANTPFGGLNYADLVGGIVRRVYGRPHGAKHLARALGKSHRTCERYVSGERVPTGDDLLALLRECQELRDEIKTIIEKAEHA